LKPTITGLSQLQPNAGTLADDRRKKILRRNT